jgi:hypothetical protein
MIMIRSQPTQKRIVIVLIRKRDEVIFIKDVRSSSSKMYSSSVKPSSALPYLPFITLIVPTKAYDGGDDVFTLSSALVRGS